MISCSNNKTLRWGWKLININNILCMHQQYLRDVSPKFFFCFCEHHWMYWQSPIVLHFKWKWQKKIFWLHTFFDSWSILIYWHKRVWYGCNKKEVLFVPLTFVNIRISTEARVEELFESVNFLEIFSQVTFLFRLFKAGQTVFYWSL